MIASRHQILMVCAVVTVSAAQNLVPNPGFEEVNQNYCGDFGKVEQFEATMKNWILPTRATPRISDMDVTPGCWNYIGDSDFIRPRSGRRMILLNFFSGSNYRSYLEVPLVEELKEGKRYHTEIWVHLLVNQERACNNIGLYFSDTLVRVQLDKSSPFENAPFMRVLPFDPQVNHTQIVSDTSGWVCLKSSFIAKARAKYLLIGNFFPDEQTNTQGTRNNTPPLKNGVFYQIDDVYVGLTSKTKKEKRK